MTTLHSQLEKDDLAVGLTRPPMIMGVTLELAFVLIMLAAIGYIYLQNIWILVASTLLYGISLILSNHEPCFYQIYWKCWTKTKPLLTYSYWGKCNSYSPE